MTAPFLLDEMSEESACLAGRSTYVATYHTLLEPTPTHGLFRLGPGRTMSGETVRRGGITKTGNTHARRVLSFTEN